MVMNLRECVNLAKILLMTPVGLVMTLFLSWIYFFQILIQYMPYAAATADESMFKTNRE